MDNNQDNKIDNLWGDLPVEDFRTPHVVLREQASILTEKTEGKLVGNVVKGKFSSVSYPTINAELSGVTPKMSNKLKDKRNKYALTSRLEIVVPSINNYSISIVEIDCPLEMYPSRIMNLVIDDYQYQECRTEVELKQALAEILSSDRVRKIIAGLLTEIRADVK